MWDTMCKDCSVVWVAPLNYLTIACCGIPRGIISQKYSPRNNFRQCGIKGGINFPVVRYNVKDYSMVGDTPQNNHLQCGIKRGINFPNVRYNMEDYSTV